MKARIKKTGEIINLADYARITLDKCDSWGNPIEVSHDEVELIQEMDGSMIDWEQRRYEIAKDMLPQAAISVNVDAKDWMNGMSYPEASAIVALSYADALIEQLKKSTQTY